MGKMINFRHVNAAGDFTKLLNHHGLEFTQNGQQVRLLCPFHDDTNPSLSITLDATDNAQANTFHCFGCGKKGSLIDFEKELTGVELRDAARTVAEVSGCQLAPPRTSKNKPLRGAQKPQERQQRENKPPSSQKASKGPSEASEEASRKNIPLKFTLNLDMGHECVLGRLDADVAEVFGIGVARKGSLQDRICIPIHNEDGQLVAYAGRWPEQVVPDGEDKYQFPPKFNKMAELFNLHRLNESDQHIVIVEGFFSAIRLHQLGVPVVALMGTAISDEHVMLLKRHGVKSVLVLLDGDEPGRLASARVGQALMQQLFTRVVTLPQDRSPDELDEMSLGAFLPYWPLKNQF